ncbi:MAG: SPFH domain-containing protein, partial [Candidatus Hermodarchaeota archaeon]
MISKGRKVYEYDGKGRYRYFPFLHGRTIIPKHVLDIESGLLNLHDCNDLPFGVELSIKVQVTDPQKVAASLTQLDHSTLSKVVEDIVMTTARSIAMERTILDIMKNREEIEKSVYEIVVDALNKLGISVIIFDIKNIRDVEGRDVIGSLERQEQARLEQERQARLEQERQARLEQERQARLEQERQARLEQERQARLEQERQARLEQERQARLEQERQARLEQERQARLEQERQARLEQEQQTRLEPEQEQKLIAE